jgi:hypothetical protein
MTTLKTIEVARLWFIYRHQPTYWKDSITSQKEGKGHAPAPDVIEERARELLASDLYTKEEYAIAFEMEDGTWIIEVDDEWLGTIYRIET